MLKRGRGDMLGLKTFRYTRADDRYNKVDSDELVAGKYMVRS